LLCFQVLQQLQATRFGFSLIFTLYITTFPSHLRKLSDCVLEESCLKEICNLEQGLMMIILIFVAIWASLGVLVEEETVVSITPWETLGPNVKIIVRDVFRTFFAFVFLLMSQIHVDAQNYTGWDGHEKSQVFPQLHTTSMMWFDKIRLWMSLTLWWTSTTKSTQAQSPFDNRRAKHSQN